MADNNWIRPDHPSKCTFDLKKSQSESPHNHNALKKIPLIASTILECVGNTGLVRINDILSDEGIECEVLAKCEFLNPGGSVKDRIAVRMVEEGEKLGIYKPGDTLIEATSGNTGIGLAMTAAARNYKCVIVMPEKMSKEKCDLLRMLGAELVRTRTSAAIEDVDSHIQTALRIKRELGDSAHIPDQYTNPYNPIEHFDQTAEEILSAVTEENGEPEIDMIVMGAGTGGTAAGIARKFKQKVPNCKIVCVDPVGSSLADHFLGPVESSGTYDVEGIGYNFNPTVLEKTFIDSWVRTNDQEAFTMARRLISQEGLLCGGSSGSAMAGAVKAIKAAKLGKGDRVVVVLPDSIRNYMTKFLSDEWMFANNYLSFPSTNTFTDLWFDRKIDELLDACDIQTPEILGGDFSVEFSVSKCLARLAIIMKSSKIIGVFDPKSALTGILNGTCTSSDPVFKICNKEYKQLESNMPVEKLSRLLVYYPYVVINRRNKEPVIVVASDVLNFSMKAIK